MNQQPVEVAIAILYHDNQFLMQLRDNIPTIAFPGYWGLFGGHIEPGEDPETAVQRELVEEIGYVMPSVEKFGIYPNEIAVRHVFHTPLKVSLAELTLTEGWDMGLLTQEDIMRGEHFSAIADQVRPIGAMHQRILLDFIQSRQQ